MSAWSVGMWVRAIVWSTPHLVVVVSRSGGSRMWSMPAAPQLAVMV